TAGTWAAMRQLADANAEHLIVQRYRIPTGVRPAAYVNFLVELGCSTVVTTGHAAREAVASRLAERPVPHVRFVLTGDRPLSGTTHLSSDAVSARALSKWVTGGGSGMHRAAQHGDRTERAVHRRLTRWAGPECA
ncbi:hypothetical protein ACIRQQ_48635, partial [Streptomyces fuscichromogenes]|uniref:hypothetical protein n=1 Tax=Streptomyces fuscichromogenes TaxID=1324013 RepID=UPI00382AA8CD